MLDYKDFLDSLLNKTTTTTTTTTCGGSCSSGSSTPLTDCSPLNVDFLPNMCSEDEFSSLCAEYERSIGTMSLFVKGRLKEWLGTLDVYSISYAIGEAAGAPRPSWRYCEAILWRLYREETKVNEMASRPSRRSAPPPKLGF